MKKVLVVDDEPSIANFISDVVQTLGYEVRTLHSGRDVVSVSKDWRPDLITLDIMMPPPDGLEVLLALKADAQTRGIPVFIVSVVAKAPDMESRLELAHSIFSKPLDTKYFLNQIRETLSLK